MGDWGGLRKDTCNPRYNQVFFIIQWKNFDVGHLSLCDEAVVKKNCHMENIFFKKKNELLNLYVKKEGYMELGLTFIQWEKGISNQSLL